MSIKPRLIRLSIGSPKEIPLGSETLTIGRDPSSGLRLDEPIVSSNHCRIEHERDGFVLVDCDSLNGTFINGSATSRSLLEHGDEILIGSAKFCFLLDDSAPPSNRIRIEKHDQVVLISSRSTVLGPMDPLDVRISEDMRVLLTLSSEINQIDSSSELQEVLLKRIFEIVPAEEGVILLGSSTNEVLNADSPLQRRRISTGRQISISRTVVEHVFKSGESMLRNDILAEPLSESIVASGIRSVLCIPLVMVNTTIGIVYLTTTNRETPFDETHLRLTVAIAAIAAVALEHLRYVEWLEAENRQLEREVEIRHEMIGASPKMQEVYEKISILAPTSSPVLILGETGTGKELTARAIHNNSSRRNGPFVAVNGAGITETLYTVALFGTVKGAYTGGPDRDTKGFIEEADGGTLFLDELGDIPIHCQASLLRVIEEQKVLRVGSTRPIAVDIRLISATNHSLKDDIRGGRFREDLYFRMGLQLELPPLRERLDDIPLLVKFFVQKFRHLTSREIGATPPSTLRALQEYSWPGNVRELGSAIRYGGSFWKIRPNQSRRSSY